MGGKKLKKYYGKDTPIEKLGETWECSTHSDGLSIVASGEYSGRTLRSVLREHPEFLGTSHNVDGQLPVLIKLIDARENLSIQVHPDDCYAKQYENGSLGKTEMWYILEAQEEGQIVCGFNNKISKETLLQGVYDGSIEKYLQKIKVKENDTFYIEPGTVHGIGAGIVLAEIQEASNLTYRLYDYNRLDNNGKTRELHVKKALDVVNLQSYKELRQPMRILKYRLNYAEELLCKCNYFRVERILINNISPKISSQIDFAGEQISILLCIKGKGSLLCADEEISLEKGKCIFIPSQAYNIFIEGYVELLKVSC